MGSDLKRRRKTVYKREVRGVLKTKGERLGWESLENEKEVSLRTIVGEGTVVNSSCCFIAIGRKVLL